MKTEIFPVAGMTCSGCARTVQNILKNQQGVAEAMVDLAHAQATVTYDETRISATAMAEVLGKMGYALTTANR
jgi:copper chaperone CopZ